MEPAADCYEVDPLTQLAMRHGTDKWGPHFYTPIYHQLFAALRERPIRLLEIGVGGYGHRLLGGASLAMWADYFSAGRIFGIDVAPKTLDLGPRVTLLRGSQTDTEFLAHVCAEYGPFDVIIDDGSHVPKESVRSFVGLFAGLKDGGFYVIEDVQTAYWPRFGGTAEGGATLEWAARILDDINHAEIGVFDPLWQSSALALKLKAFHAYHNLFVVEKGDNDEPSNYRYDANNRHAALAIATIEAQYRKEPAPAIAANLAGIYRIAGRADDGLALIATALDDWPKSFVLLHSGYECAVALDRREQALEFCRRALALDPEDSAWAKKLSRIVEAPAAPDA